MLAWLLSGMPAWAQLDVDALAERSTVAYEQVPRRVMAFYYAWYGSPDGPSGKWLHWHGVDREGKSIESSTHWPMLGPYDSNDLEVIDRHCRWARDAGIDTLIVSWWGHGSPDDRALPKILDTCQKYNLSVTVYHERVPGDESPEAAAKDILRLLKRYADHPAWLRVGAKPVVFVYVRSMNQLGPAGWLRAIDQINKEYTPGVVMMADRLDDAAALIFDGIHTYNTAGSLRQASSEKACSFVDGAYGNWVELARHRRRISTLTVIPGYNDTKIRKPGLRTGRLDGELYQIQWEAAIQASPDWVLVTSFNEWHEGSEIEPSAEYGERYLQDTARYARQFKSAPRPTVDQAERDGTLPAEALKALKAKLQRAKIGLLEGADSAAVWWLVADVGEKPVQLSWREVVEGKAEGLGILVYAGGEEYVDTVSRPGDVNLAIEAYLRQGGTLVVTPSGPMPFHYGVDHRTVAAAQRFGLPLNVGGDGPKAGWEIPPDDSSLIFKRRDLALEHLPAALPFPNVGDRRWRPFDSQRLPQGINCRPLLTLFDSAGQDRGDAAVLVQRPGAGRVLYSWYRLLSSPYAEPLMYDLFNLAAE